MKCSDEESTFDMQHRMQTKILSGKVIIDTQLR